MSEILHGMLPINPYCKSLLTYRFRYETRLWTRSYYRLLCTLQFTDLGHACRLPFRTKKSFLSRAFHLEEIMRKDVPHRMTFFEWKFILRTCIYGLLTTDTHVPLYYIKTSHTSDLNYSRIHLQITINKIDSCRKDNYYILLYHRFISHAIVT